MSPSLVKRVFDQLLNMRRNPVSLKRAKLEQIKKVNALLINAISILSNI